VAITMHRRLLWFGGVEQALQILPLFIAAHAVSLLARLASGGMFPGWWLLLAPVFEALLWPLVSWLLLAPQRRAARSRRESTAVNASADDARGPLLHPWGAA
jgi:rod shape-determining protein MreD